MQRTPQLYSNNFLHYNNCNCSCSVQICHQKEILLNKEKGNAVFSKSWSLQGGSSSRWVLVIEIYNLFRMLVTLFEEMLMSLSHIPNLTFIFKDKLMDKRNTF